MTNMTMILSPLFFTGTYEIARSDAVPERTATPGSPAEEEQSTAYKFLTLLTGQIQAVLGLNAFQQYFCYIPEASCPKHILGCYNQYLPISCKKLVSLKLEIGLEQIFCHNVTGLRVVYPEKE